MFTLDQLDELDSTIINELQTSSATRHIKNLQASNIQRVVTAVGIFSIFEAVLQKHFEQEDGFAFSTGRKQLIEKGHTELEIRLSQFKDAVNTLKHGSGSSYLRLLSQSDSLPFRIKKTTKGFFDEGNVSEVDTLILVDREFVQNCVQLIEDASVALELY